MWGEIKVIERTEELQSSLWDFSHVGRSRGLRESPMINSGRPKRKAGEKRDTLGVPVLLEPPFPHYPSPKVFIAHLLCLAQMVDSASFFTFIFFCRRLFWAQFHSPSSPDSLNSLGTPEWKRTQGDQWASRSPLHMMWRGDDAKGLGHRRKTALGRFLTLWKKRLFLFKSTKEQR